MEEIAPRSPNLKTWAGFLVIINIRSVFQIHYCLIRELQIMVSRAYTTFYLPLLQLSYNIFLEIEVFNARPTTKGRDACHNFILQKAHTVLFFLLFSGEVLLFQAKVLILEVFLNVSNYYIYNHSNFFLKH